MSGLADLLTGAQVIVCCGSGGVGKTTVSAALAYEAARRGRRTIVITIDPARRLADALGVTGELGNEPVHIDVDCGPGELWALMLDASDTFDGLVRANASSDEQAERILANSFYRNVAGTLSGTQDFMAAERLYALHHDDRFDLVVVDTPPTRSALDFLAAPRTLTRFLDHPLFKMLMMPTRRGLRVINFAAQPVLRMIGAAVGAEVLGDATAFFQAFSGMEGGFRDRADEVAALVNSPITQFVLVCSPRPDTAEEAVFFADRLHDAGIAVHDVVVNRATPDFGAPKGARPSAAARAALHDNQRALHDTAVAERAIVAEHLEPVVRASTTGSATWVPLLPTDVHDLATLDHVRRHLVATTDGG